MAFAAVENLDGSPSLLDLVLYAVGAAVAVGALEGAVTRGFRRRVRAAPAEVNMLGTAMNAMSVAVAAGAAMLCGATIGGVAVWPTTGFVVAGVYVLAESVEVLVAEVIQRRREGREAEREEVER